MTLMTGGQATVESLLANGVDTVFGVIATHTLYLYDALYDRQDSLRHIGGRSEPGIGFMAGGYARASGRPGVFLTSAGPGAAESMPAMGEEYQSSIPLLQVTSNVESHMLGLDRGARHESKDQTGMLRSVTGWNALIPTIQAIPDHVAQAFRHFQVHRPRPIALEVPTDLLQATAEVEVTAPPAVELPMGSEQQVERVARLLRQARRPLLLAGDQVALSGATPELVRLAEALDAPVGLLEGAKGGFPDDHPLALGLVFGGRQWGRNALWEDLLPTCDLTVVVGSALLYRDTLGLGLPLPSPLVHIDLDAERFNKNYPAEVAIAAHPVAVLRQLLSALGDGDLSKGDGYRRDIAHAKARAYSALVEQWPNEVRMMEALRGVLPRETIVVTDIMAAGARAERAFDIYAPRTYLKPWGWAGLGFGLPAALGATVACPDRPVVCLTGDGGFQYNLQELGTAVQERLSPIVLVFNDQAWGIIKQRQASLLGGRYIGTDLRGPDLVRLAEAYGVAAQRVTTLAELLPAVEAALEERDTLHLIDVQTPRGIKEFR